MYWGFTPKNMKYELWNIYFLFQPIDRNFRAVAEGDALSGRVKYRGQDRSEKEVQFGETDQVIKQSFKYINT